MMRGGIAEWRTLAISLLCVFILAASLDKIPDPPAVQPFRSGAEILCPVNHIGGCFDQEGNRARPFSAPLVVVRWFDFRIVFEPDHPLYCATLIGQAADS